MGRNMGALVRAVVKDMQWNRPVEKIAERQGVSEEVVEQILQIYTTHNGGQSEDRGCDPSLHERSVEGG